MFSKNNKQAGFSLVELMVVVAIIGILASIAIPSVNKYMAKARQSEAKTNLASLYTAEKAFFAEYNAYDSRFFAVGFSPEGGVRYNVGFTASVVAPAGSGFNVTPPSGTTGTAFNILGYCGAAGAYRDGCTVLNGANNIAPPALAAADCPASASGAPAGCTVTNGATPSFQAGATAVIQSGNPAVQDSWAIDNSKMLRNTRVGIR